MTTSISPAIVWTNLLGQNNGAWEYAHAVTVGSDGSIYVAGATRASLDGLSTWSFYRNITQR